MSRAGAINLAVRLLGELGDEAARTLTADHLEVAVLDRTRTQPRKFARLVQAADYAEAAHVAMGCRGVSRSDFRYDDVKDDLVLLEVNTQPGMAPTSLAPEQAAHTGMSYDDLVRWMVEDASCPR